MTSSGAGTPPGAPAVDPIGEAGQWLDRELAGRRVPSLLAIIGLGDGCLLEALEHRSPNARVLALEPDPQAAKSFLARRDWRGWLDSGRLVYLVDPDYAGADDAWRIFPAVPDSHKVLVHPDVARKGGQGAVRAARVLKRIVFGARANAEARRRFAPRYLTNVIRNLPALTAGQDVRALTHVFHGVPAVVAAAGPSLDEAVADLRDAAGRAVLIASDTALRPLLDSGVAPHLVVAVDPGAANARHFQALPDCSETWLVSESALDRTVTRAFEGRTFWFRVADHHPWPWLNGLGIDLGHVDVWGSVLTAAFQVAAMAGCDPIVLVGADLAFTGGRPYCRGTTYEFDWAYSTAQGEALDRAWRAQMARSEQCRVRDCHGGETITTSVLLSFRDWLVSRAARSGRRVINATGAGIFFGDGIEQASLSEVLRVRCAIPSLQAIARAAPSTLARSHLAACLRTLRGTIATGAPPVAPAAEWAEFSGDGYDAVAVGAALEEAARALEAASHERPSVPAPGIPWARLSRSDVTRRVLKQLPEAIARLRAALTGVGPLPPLTPAGLGPDDRAALLMHAFDLLKRIVDSVRDGGGDLESPIAGESVDLLPASGHPAWPERTRWAIQICEALLGMAWESSLPTAESSFYARPVSLRDLSAVPCAPEANGAGRPASEEACARLALGWALATSTVGQVAAHKCGPLVERMLGLAVQLRPSGRSVARDGAATLVLRAERVGPLDGALPEFGSRSGRRMAVLGAHGAPARERRGVPGPPRATEPGCGAEPHVSWSDSVELPLPLGEAALARVLTGSVWTPATERLESRAATSDAPASGGISLRVGREGPAELSASIELRLGSMAPSGRRGTAIPGEQEAPLVTPRILTDEGVARSVVAYATGRGVVCVPFHGLASILVHEDGSVETHHCWPRPIFGELPMGAEGTVAWSNGSANWSQEETGYVVYRSRAGGPVTIEEVPFRPSAGTWWRDRLYWAGFPSGVCSWAPGAEATCSLPDVTLFAVRAGTTELLLDPCVRARDGLLRRRLLTCGWRWDGEGQPKPVALGPYGAQSSCSAAHGWTAVVHPEADLVRLESAGRADVCLTCYYPFGVAWVGRSLLVSTVDGDLLLFEHLIDVVEQATRDNRRG